ncbi:hypothetical protein ACN2WE_40240 [Streptomyces sp. cg28]|uniref:hypothetical protein n=1 Tax=Streptomyces sp. cg28 TaxID=3403457 RepID=UPI003B21676B
MSSPLTSTPRRRLATISALGGLCPFAWWAAQPVDGDTGDYDPCGAETRHPRLYGWLGL